ncbi:hypothetical protein MEE_01430 [Bartonella elizabethae F9251 = ATCC 49927]|uniref:Uncharacterized protein n=1 Tax=Bartonella elizabethae F9251 = ATCC 49927 TaxID=1094555 RepID=J1K8Y8_BAREL|nr:hypothetical protein [Bartonella elizabethae]EJF93830.1 hypothetical protein MEE_01430 [Bartonella elizabethae F9251 = ATCC 49927]VEJ41907.1 Uncharacterised protein [Bartonella elizabethae]
MEIDDSLELWRLSKKLTISQAALLIAGLNPGKCRFVNKIEPEKGDIYEDNVLLSLENTANFRAAYYAIVQAGKDHRLTIEWSYYNFQDFIDADSSHVPVKDLKKWLSSCGQRPAFFFPKGDSHEIKDQKYAFQDKNHPHYAPKLAAAVAAWEAVSKSGPIKTVKGTLAQWLEQNADQYDLRNKKNGKLKSDAIEQISIIANWKPTGGAPPKEPAN